MILPVDRESVRRRRSEAGTVGDPYLMQASRLGSSVDGETDRVWADVDRIGLLDAIPYRLGRRMKATAIASDDLVWIVVPSFGRADALEGWCCSRSSEMG